MKKLLYFLTCFALSVMIQQGYAQSLDDQLLIFRNTGETNLLYQSEIDSITFTNVDTLGVEHDCPVAQVFHTADTTLYVALAEIDSVCFGSRNAIEYRPDVRMLNENLDMQWIIRYDGSNIYYKVETPANVLPAKGQKLYFSEQTELFPFGLCAKVDNVVRGSDEITVSVSSIDYSEVFKKFFYAGSMDGITPSMAKAHRAQEVDKGETVKSSIDIGEHGSLAVDGRVGVRGDVVLNPFRHYYHAAIEIENVLGFSIKANAEESAEYNFEHNFLHIPLPTVAAIFQPSMDVGLFVDMNAELAFEYAMDRKATTRIEWTRRDGKQEFKRCNPTEDGKQGNTAKIQITLNGSIFAGLQTAFNFDMVGDVVGATAKVKYGSDFNGELSMGLLADLSKAYDVSAYGKAELALQSKLKFEGDVKHRSGWLWGDVEETTIMEYEHVIHEEKIDLFPHFFAPRAVAAPKKDNVSVAVKSKNEIAHKVETGFQVLTERPNTTHELVPIEEVFVKDIEVAEEDSIQGVGTIMVLPETMPDVDSIFVRPVFHYAGYTIPHATITAMTDPNIQPVIFSMANGSATVVSGVPFADNTIVDNTLYNIGPYISIPHNDTVFHKISPYVGIGEGYLYYEDAQNLVGTWEGQIDRDDIRLTFAADDSCDCRFGDTSMSNAKCHINEPQSGCILIESTDKTIILDIQSITCDSLTFRFKNSKYKGKECTLRKSGI